MSIANVYIERVSPLGIQRGEVPNKISQNATKNVTISASAARSSQSCCCGEGCVRSTTEGYLQRAKSVIDTCSVLLLEFPIRLIRPLFWLPTMIKSQKSYRPFSTAVPKFHVFGDRLLGISLGSFSQHEKSYGPVLLLFSVVESDADCSRLAGYRYR